METKSRSFPLSAVDKFVRLTDGKLDLQATIEKVRGPGYGATVTFSGGVRGTEKGRAIQSITYEAYFEMAVQEMEKIVVEAEARWPVRVALQHRAGEVPVGESSIVIACGGAHRQEAFDACRYVIDEIKTRVPVWKVKFS